jgi:hypothetical protein
MPYGQLAAHDPRTEFALGRPARVSMTRLLRRAGNRRHKFLTVDRPRE